jgi:hypothetical protein
MIEQYIEYRKLPEKIRTAISAALLGFRPELLSELPALEAAGKNVFALAALFPWNKTPEGFLYWQGVNLEAPQIKISHLDLC